MFIDAPHPTVHCVSCRVEIELRGDGASLWPWVIHNALRSEGRGGKFVNDNLLNTGAVVPFVYLASHCGTFPTCSECNAPIPEMQSVAHGTTGEVACPGCAAVHPTWPATYTDADGDETSVQVFMAPPNGASAPPGAGSVREAGALRLPELRLEPANHQRGDPRRHLPVLRHRRVSPRRDLEPPAPDPAASHLLEPHAGREAAVTDGSREAR